MAFQQIFNLQDIDILFDVILHVGTLVAVFVFYWQDIIQMIREFIYWLGELLGLRKPSPKNNSNGHRTMMFMIIIATIPTAIIGFAFNDFFEKAFSSIKVVGFTLLLTGLLLWLSGKVSIGRKRAKDIKTRDALTVGLFQGAAIIPGLSRSGTTIFTGLLRGFDLELATKFSFLLSIPSIIGAVILEGRKAFISGNSFTGIQYMLIGLVVAAVSGYFSIRYLVSLIKKNKLYYFSYYCWGVGLLIIIYSLFN